MNSNSTKFEKFEEMEKKGMKPTVAYRYAKEHGMSELDCFAMLKHVYRLSLTQIKETTIKAYDPNDSLDAHQQRLAEQLGSYLDEDNI